MLRLDKSGGERIFLSGLRLVGKVAGVLLVGGSRLTSAGMHLESETNKDIAVQLCHVLGESLHSMLAHCAGL